MVYAHPDGESTVNCVAAATGRYDCDGVVVRTPGTHPDYDCLREALDAGVVDVVETDAPDPE